MTEKSVNVYNNAPTELRCSKVISNCSCIKANGLQDGCERSKCKKNCEMAYRQMVPTEAFPNVKAHPEPARHRPVHQMQMEGANIPTQQQETNEYNRTQHTPRSQFTLQEQPNASQYVGDGQNMQRDNAIQRAQYEAAQNQGDLGQAMHQKAAQEHAAMHMPNELYSGGHQQCCHCEFGQPAAIKAYYVPQGQAMQQENQAQQYAASMQGMQQQTAAHYAMHKQTPTAQYQQVATTPQHPTMQMPQQMYGHAAAVAPQTVVVQLPQEQAQPQTIRVQMPQQAMPDYHQQQEQSPAIGHQQHNQYQQVAGHQQHNQFQQVADQQQIPFQHVVGGVQQPAAIQAGAQQVPFQQQVTGQQQVDYHQAGGQQVPYQAGGQQVPYQAGGQQVPYQAGGQQQVPFQQAQQQAGGQQQITGQQAQFQQVNQTATDAQGQQNSWGMNPQENMQHYNSSPHEEQPVVNQQMS